jgi:hypothetical protein
LGKELIDVLTNARETVIARIRKVDMVCSSMWARVAHACGLAGIAHALEKRFRKAIISSTYTFREQSEIAYGTTAMTDPLLSTQSTNLFHYGSGFTRAEKVMYIARSEVTMRTLQVCWRLETEKNCGNCLKCYQTMIPLEIAGVLDRCTTFEQDSLDAERLEHLFIEHDYQAPFFRELEGLARTHDRADIAEALARAFKRSAMIRRRRRLGDYLTSKPLLWRLVPPIRRSIRKLEADSIRQPSPAPPATPPASEDRSPQMAAT